MALDSRTHSLSSSWNDAQAEERSQMFSGSQLRPHDHINLYSTILAFVMNMDHKLFYYHIFEPSYPDRITVPDGPAVTVK